jgi:hypothetical protein
MISEATQQIDEWIVELDAIYQDSLTAYRDMIVSAQVLDRRLEDMGVSHVQRNAMEFAPIRSLVPAEIFRQLAEVLLHRVRPLIDPHSAKVTVRVGDLIDWTGEPPRLHSNQLDHALDRIEAARGQTLRTFYTRLAVRLNPDDVPRDAVAVACRDLLDAFCVQIASSYVIGRRASEHGQCIFMRLTRDERQMPWHLTVKQVIQLERALMALSAISAVQGESTHATVIAENGTSVIQRFRGRTDRYGDSELHALGSSVRLVLHRDCIDVHLAPEVWEAVRVNLESAIQGLRFLEA